MDDEKIGEKQKFIDAVKKDMDYNLEMLDASILKFSAIGIGLLVYVDYKFGCSSLNIYFALGLSFLFTSFISQLISFKTAAISQDYYIWFLSDPDDEFDAKSRLKVFKKYIAFNYISIFLSWTTLCSFVLGYIFIGVIFCVR
jgi:hypothetical protein